jgi:hypothetical protein
MCYTYLVQVAHSLQQLDGELLHNLYFESLRIFDNLLQSLTRCALEYQICLLLRSLHEVVLHFYDSRVLKLSEYGDFSICGCFYAWVYEFKNLHD